MRDLEALHLVAGGRHAAILLISESPDPDRTPVAVAASAEKAAPHMSALERRLLLDGYLGQITWEHACSLLSVDYASLPDTADELG